MHSDSSNFDLFILMLYNAYQVLLNQSRGIKLNKKEEWCCSGNVEKSHLAYLAQEKAVSALLELQAKFSREDWPRITFTIAAIPSKHSVLGSAWLSPGSSKWPI